ncbi:MAG: sugar phosphate nucleotidyltransferase [Dehalococcoidia bacterium]
MERITQAIVLAAGEGQRLKPLTVFMPKVMLPIADKPILQYVVEALAENGIRRIVMVVGYRREQVQDHFGSGQEFGVDIEYVIQNQQIGTAHALKQAESAADDTFLLVSGDNMISADTIAPLVNTTSPTVLIKAHGDISRYGVVIVHNGLLREIVEKPPEKLSGLINTGTYVFNREIFDFIEDEVRLNVVIQKMIDKGREIATLETEGFWQDVVYPWDIITLNGSCLSQISPSLGGTIEEGSRINGLVSIGDGTIIRSNCYIVGPAIIGEDCEIGPNVCIFPSTSIRNGVTIAPFTVISNSCIGNNISIGAGSSINDSIIYWGTLIGSHFAARSSEGTVKIDNEYHQVKMGTIIGSYCEFGDSVTVEPGTIIGNHCLIKPMKLIGENIPDNGLVV